MTGSTLLVALVATGTLALLLGAALGAAAALLPERGERLVGRIDALLPQTQCGQCRYPGCRPYAAAIARGEADIDRCPPGGEDTVRALAALLDRDAKPLDPAFGPPPAPAVAWIDEDRCVGCALCLPACPVDAIVGARRFVHTVVARDCTGCALCLPPCPVDCIELRPLAVAVAGAGRAA